MAFITPGQVSNIPKKPLTLPSDWVRAADWPTITDDANKIQMLVSDIGTQSSATYSTYTINTVFTRVTGGHNVFIDWGDGTPIDTVTTTTSTNTSHNYTTGGATCSRGYKTWIITITKDTTVNITTCNLVAPVNLSSPIYFPSGLLELYMGDTIGANVDMNNKYGNANTITGNYPNLEYVKMPSTWNGTSLAYGFWGCASLGKIVLPTSMTACTSFNQTFQNCVSLQKVTMPTTIGGATVTLQNAFAACTSLYSVTFPSSTYSTVTSCLNMFLYSTAIDNLTLPSFPACTSYQAAFNGCSSLTNIKVPIDYTGSVTLTNMFANCISLVRCDITSPSNGSGQTWNMTSMFSACRSLPYFKMPSSVNASTMANAFQNCNSITRIDVSTGLSGSISMSNAFASCGNLTSISLPSTMYPTTMASAFSGCSSLLSVTVPNTNQITDLSSTFANATSLTSVTFTGATTSTADACTTMNSCFTGCSQLVTLTLPTSLNSVQTLNTCFNGCASIKSITLPSSMSALTTSGFQSAFTDCKELKTLTLPTTINSSGITNLSSMFSGCNSLTSVTLPALGTNVSSLSSTFLDTWSLQSINFGAGTMSGGVNCTSMLTRSSVNTLINLSYLGGSTASQASAVDGTTLGTYAPFCATYSFTARFSKLDISGVSANPNAYVRSLRLLYSTSTGQWAGSSPQINISYTGINYANLVTLFNDMAAQGTVTGKTINITSCTGSSSLTAADRLIVTSKGWTITG